MASSSTSSLHKRRFKYDVFLSFRGEDVRKTFIDHLYASLDRQGILTFRDDKKLKKGGRIDNELIKSIQDSKIFIIVFSQNYASSSWCLNELVEIMECHKKNNNNQIAYPVFYDVDPSEVRKQRESYGEALAKHNKKEVEKWREALREAGSLSGYDVKNIADGLEAEVIKQIVAEILNRLCFTYYLSNDEKLVGMETRMLDLLSCLEIDSSDVRMIGIKGMGGAGKTTLARAIFERISLHFEGVSFVDNVREKSKASVSGLQSLQEKILSDVLKEPDFAAGSLFDSKLMMRYRLRGIKALVVLDDVDDLSQLEALAGASDWFKPGSRIIITTRDEKVLVAHGVEIKHDVNLLSDEEAICLFSRYAFKGDIPLKGYEEHSRKVVDYAAGLPLTIKVLGSFLHDEGESVWIDVLKRLKTIPLKQTQDILELSYNSLEDEHKEIFLDVACLQKGWNKKKAIRTLESCRFHATYGLRVLQQKSLITFSQDCDIFSSFFDDDAAVDDDDDDDDVYLDMHDHMQEMGRNIVRREYPYDPSKHSRLWINNEIEDLLVNELGTKATRCLKVVTSLDPEIIMKGLSGMKNLKFLHVNGTSASDWKCDEASQYFLNALQYLHWNSYPFRFLPKGFQANNLVSLEMPFSKIEQLWEEGERKVLDNLKFLDLSCSKLTKLDLVLTPNLEVLKLKSCFHLLELDMPIRCPKLRSIDLSYSKLTKLDLGMTPNLEVLKLKKCRYSLELPMTVGCPKLRSLNLSNLKVTKLDLRLSSYLETLYLECCFNLVELNMPVECLKLKSLDLSFCALKKLNLRLTPNLEVLNLSRSHYLVELNMPVQCLKLRSLDLKFLALKKLDLGLTSNLEVLNVSHCPDLIAFGIVECLKLRSLVLSLPLFKNLDPGLIPNLETLCLHGKWYEWLEPHMRIACRKLTSLTITCLTSTTLDLGLCPDLIHCEISWSKLKTFDLALTPKLRVLKLKDCHDLEELQMNVGCLKELAHLELVGCSGLKSFVLTKEQESHECPSILPLDSNDGMPKISISCFYKEQTPTSTENLEKLISLGSCHCSNLKSILETTDWFPNLKEVILGCSIPEMPEDSGKLEHVEELNFSCTMIRDLPDNIVELKDLKSLKLERCTSLEELPENIDGLDSLEKLHLSSTRIKHLPNEVCRLKRLKSLELVCCSFLEKLPENLGRLECLEDLILQKCKLLQHIPNSICEMKSLRRFHLPYCAAVEKLPEEIGHLESLVELNILGTGIRHLPENIRSLKDLCIIRYTWHLDMNGFTFASVQRISETKPSDEF